MLSIFDFCLKLPIKEYGEEIQKELLFRNEIKIPTRALIFLMEKSETLKRSTLLAKYERRCFQIKIASFFACKSKKKIF
jgi:hypothetical protein